MVEELKVSAVELAGFFNWTAKDLQKQLKDHDLRVCGVHGPVLRPGRTSEFYCDWAKRYLELFETNNLVLETTPDLLPVGDESASEKAYAAVADLLVLIARTLAPNVQVSYHCFPHDFTILNGRWRLAEFFDRADKPDNLGLQLDTFWLQEARVAPDSVASLTVHSLHLNERDDSGCCCVLGTHPERCAGYVRALVATGRKINWILENDWILGGERSEATAMRDDPPHLRTICECVKQWPVFWASLTQAPAPKAGTTESTSPELPLIQSPPGVDRQSQSPVQTKEHVRNIYKEECSIALTEFLFGEQKALTTLEFNDPRIQFYIAERKASASGSGFVKLLAEQQLFEKYWPPAANAQVIQIIGGTGSGKSTFIRYFFQYFLPHWELLQAQLSGSGAIPPAAGIFATALRRHMILYVDLRRPDPEGFRQCVFKRLSESLFEEARSRGLSEVVSDPRKPPMEDWVKRNTMRLAQETDEIGRKWYISWVFDNTDQLYERSQADLVRIIHDYIPEEQSHQWASDPVTDEKRALWRIIIPVRPETHANLTRCWAPFHNKEVLHLGPINPDALVESRGQLLLRTVHEYERHLHEDLHFGDAPRPFFELKTPGEMAESFRDTLLAAGGIDKDPHAITSQARQVLDQLVNDSARKRLSMLSRVAFSRCFRERHELGQREHWRVRVIDFYFFNGLICGDASEFIPSPEECPILNLYDLGAKSGSAHSIFVGLHSIYLLAQGRPWGTVKATLKRIAYTDEEITRCESWLERAEITKRLHSGAYQIEYQIVQGLWALLKQPAYTDAMAVASGQAWGQPSHAPRTDPLNPQELLPCFRASLWFMQQVWEAEKYVATHREEAVQCCGPFTKFADYFDKLKFPSVVHYVATEYEARILSLRDYDRPGAAIKADEEQWQGCCKALRELLVESGRARTMTARR